MSLANNTFSYTEIRMESSFSESHSVGALNNSPRKEIVLTPKEMDLEERKMD